MSGNARRHWRDYSVGAVIYNLVISGTTNTTVGGTTQLIATLVGSNGSSVDVTSDPNTVWSSSATGKATVSGGLVSGVAGGTSNITATYNGYDVTEKVTVYNVYTLVNDTGQIINVKLGKLDNTNYTTYTLNVGQSRTIKNTAAQRSFVIVEEAGLGYEWRVNNDAVVTPINPGTYTIAKLDVATPTLTLTGTNHMYLGEDLQLSVVYDDGHGFVGDVTNIATWWSENSSIASVNSSGLVHGEALGLTIIRVSYGGANTGTTMLVENVASNTYSIKNSTGKSLNITLKVDNVETQQTIANGQTYSITNSFSTIDLRIDTEPNVANIFTETHNGVTSDIDDNYFTITPNTYEIGKRLIYTVVNEIEGNTVNVNVGGTSYSIASDDILNIDSSAAYLSFAITSTAPSGKRYTLNGSTNVANKVYPGANYINVEDTVVYGPSITVHGKSVWEDLNTYAGNKVIYVTYTDENGIYHQDEPFGVSTKPSSEDSATETSNMNLNIDSTKPYSFKTNSSLAAILDDSDCYAINVGAVPKIEKRTLRIINNTNSSIEKTFIYCASENDADRSRVSSTTLTIPANSTVTLDFYFKCIGNNNSNYPNLIYCADSSALPNNYGTYPITSYDNTIAPEYNSLSPIRVPLVITYN